MRWSGRGWWKARLPVNAQPRQEREALPSSSVPHGAGLSVELSGYAGKWWLPHAFGHVRQLPEPPDLQGHGCIS